MVRAIVEHAALDVVAAGSPRPGRSAEVAQAIGLDASAGRTVAPDDLRSVLTTCDCTAVFIASPGQFGARPDGGTGDLEALHACRARGIKIASMEPIPASALQPVSEREPGEPASPPVRFVPLARASGPMAAATEVLADFGPIRTAVFESWSRPHEGSLGARLLDAMDFVLTMLGEPERIDASYMWPAPTAGGGPLRKVPGESLRGLTGDLTANLRFSDRRGVCIALSDRAARWGRTISLVGPGGRLRLYDDGFEWIGPDGARLESSRAPGASRRGSDRTPVEGRSAGVIAEALGAILDGRNSASAPVDERRVLAMAGAALLSARTGEAESPDTIRKMAMIPA